ncbi:MAG: lipid-A-disaccharide synthase, partial [Limnochordales bacterium]
MTRLLLSAGEASGDVHGADLARALAAQAPGVQLFGMGGPMMAAAGVELLYNPTSLSTVGFLEALKSVRVLRRVLARLSAAMDERRPDGVVCIDFPGFNLRLAALAHRKGIPVLYYFSPSAWAWGRGRAAQLARLGATILAVFPFEAEVYRAAGAPVVFVGHPLVDRVRPSAGREDIRAELGVPPGGTLVALLPGSRRQELESLLPAMLAAARIIRDQRPGARFVLPMAYTLAADEVQRMALFVSRLPHCLYDILARWQSGEWRVEVPLIISNHEDLRPVAERFGIPYYCLPITPDNKPEQEARQLALLREHDIEFVVLARYMQILSPSFVEQYPERIINIHHSFLPAFAGAKPYHAAHARGVK